MKTLTSNSLALAVTHGGNGSNSLLHANGVTEGGIAQGTLAGMVNDLESRRRGFITRHFLERGLTHAIEEARVANVKTYNEYQRRMLTWESVPPTSSPRHSPEMTTLPSSLESAFPCAVKISSSATKQTISKPPNPQRKATKQ